MPKKPYFLAATDGHFYCVGPKEVRTPDVFQVKERDEITFNEKEVLQQIKVEKKSIKKQERSFHADQPRKSAIRAMEGMKIKLESDSNKDAKAAKAAEKKLKDDLKAQAQFITEQSMINKPEASPTDKTLSSVSSDDSGHSANKSSSSSINPNEKVDESKKKEDIRAIQTNESDSDSVPGHLPDEFESAKQFQEISDTETVPVDGNADETETNETGRLSRSSSRSMSPANKRNSRERSSSSDLSSVKKKPSKSRKRRHSSSSSSTSSSSTSSSESSSTSSESSSETPSSSSSGENRKRKKKHGKKSRHHKKSKKSKSKKSKKNKKSKKTDTIKRNLNIFPGQNFKWSKDDEGVVKVHSDFEVYVKKTDLDDALSQSKSPQIFIKAMVGHVFTIEALKGSTAQGFPSRHKGKKKVRQGDVLPRIDPDGRRAILKRAEQLEGEKNHGAHELEVPA